MGSGEVSKKATFDKCKVVTQSLQPDYHSTTAGYHESGNRGFKR